MPTLHEIFFQSPIGTSSGIGDPLPAFGRRFFFWRRWQIPKDGGNGTHPWNFLTWKTPKKKNKSKKPVGLIWFWGTPCSLSWVPTARWLSFFLCGLSVLVGVEKTFRSHKKIATHLSHHPIFLPILLGVVFEATLSPKIMEVESYPKWKEATIGGTHFPREKLGKSQDSHQCKSACFCDLFFSDDETWDRKNPPGRIQPEVTPHPIGHPGDHLLAARVGLLGWRIPFI